jgi:ligand-binding SRPBCC domain-containing protein
MLLAPATPDLITHGRDASEPGRYLLDSTMWLPIARTTVFGFFSDARNLQAITPPELVFRILTPGPLVLRQGSLIDYSISVRGLPMTWRTLISRWDPPHCFADEQLKGPYAQWIHTHTFSDAPDGGTVIEDSVRYRLPFDPMGRMALPLVRRELDRVFRYRTRRVRELLSTGLDAGRSLPT